MYVPCMDEKVQELLNEYEDSGDPDIADRLNESLDAARCARWEETTAQMNFTHSSRKSHPGTDQHPLKHPDHQC